MNRNAAPVLLLLVCLFAFSLWLWLLVVAGAELERRRSVQVAKRPEAAFFWLSIRPVTAVVQSNIATGNGEDKSPTKEPNP